MKSFLQSQSSPGRARRRGSVLLVVVVLLLMLAIMGTSYLLTTRMDRITSSGDAANTQMDQVVDGVRDLATSYIVNSLLAYNAATGGFQYRPANTPGYNNYDIPVYTTTQYSGGQGDLWLADRAPMLPAQFATPPTPPTPLPAAAPAWAAITEPMNDLGANGIAAFEDPTIAPAAGNPQQWNPLVNLASSTPTSYLPLYPTFETVNGVTYPALEDQTGVVHIAADASGEGIADSGLIRLPGVYADGLTYYAGIRIIDNNSAINVNTAWNSQYDYDFFGNTIMPGSGATPAVTALLPWSFPSGVGLNQLVDSRDQAHPTAGTPPPLMSLNNIRLGLAGTSPNLYNSTAAPGDNLQTPTIDDGGVSHPDFTFGTLGDAMYHQLGRRVANPGFYSNNPGGGTYSYPRYGAMGDAEGAALAYHFGLVNPSTLGPLPALAPAARGTVLSTAPVNLVEQALEYSAFWNSPNFYNVSIAGASNSLPQPNSGWRAYPTPSKAADFPLVVSQWYNDNFAYANSGTVQTPGYVAATDSNSNVNYEPNLRPLLVTRNGVSIFAPANSATPINAANPYPTVPAGALPYGDRGRWKANITYGAGDVVSYAFTPAAPNGPGENTYDYNEMSSGAYYSLQANNIGHAPLDQATDTWWSRTAPAGWTPPASAACLKANVNTALFPELFRAFWNVMYAGAVNTTPGPAPMFRSSVGSSNLATYSSATNAIARDTFAANALTAAQMQILRAAIAAVNVENLRSPDATTGLRTVIARQVSLPVAAGASYSEYAIVYGNQPQPFITEVFAQTDTQTTPAGAPGANANGGYVAIELYNPYSFNIPLVTDPTDSSWVIATIDRTQQYKVLTPLTLGASPVLPLNTTNYPVAGGPNGVPVIPANGYLLLENYNPNAVSGASQAAYRPGSSGLPIIGAISGANVSYPAYGGGAARPNSMPPLNALYIPNLASVIGQEMVIMRRRHSDGTVSTGTDGSYSWNDSLVGSSLPLTSQLNDFVPVDSFDFTDVVVGSAMNNTAAEIHYVRPSQNGITPNWECVYPGPYNGAGTVPGNDGSGVANYRQPGAQYKTWDPAMLPDPWLSGTPLAATSLGANAGNMPVSNADVTNPFGSVFTAHAIKLSDPNWPGPNKPIATAPNPAPNYFPFGGFARNGDILETPFIGAYEIYIIPTGGAKQIIDVNSVTMDAAFADNMDVTDAGVEQVGRFCPIIPLAGQVLDTLTPATATGLQHPEYWWANSLFDYLTVEDPRDNYFPNTDPSRYPPSTASAAATGIAPAPVSNSNAGVIVTTGGVSVNQFDNTSPNAFPNTDAENTESVQGLVNINTAPLTVLESLPLAVDGATSGANGTVDAGNTAALAQAIVADRTANGPFASIFDLNRIFYATSGIFIFQTGNNATGTNPTVNFLGTSASTTMAQGNLTGASTTNPNGSGVVGGFDELYLQINRLSNLITTRSDTFTVYIVVEGWQNAGTATAALVTTRRAAFIVDRNTVTPVSRAVRTVTVPNN